MNLLLTNGQARGRSTLVAGFLALVLAGCSTTPPPKSNLPQFSDQERAARAAAGTQVCSNDKILALWKLRSESQGDFTLGPGDVLQISAANVSEIKDKVVRIDANGNVTLPLIGEVKLSGLTEKEAQAELVRKLSDFMYHPQVTVFVQSYHSRQVAVTGAVASPGMLTLSADDTIGSILQRAGGMSRDAAQQVFFTPGSENAEVNAPASTPQQGASLQNDRIQNAALNASNGRVLPVSDETSPGQGAPPAAQPSPAAPGVQPTTPMQFSTEQPILINLVAAGGAGCLGIPLRPGDQIDVPMGGTIKVIGWVASPKAVQLTPGLTVLGAVAAAGGPLWAADMNDVEVIRPGKNEQTQIIKVNLNRVQELTEPDVVLESNDVVQVPYSIWRMPGYGVYYATVAVVQFAPAAAIVSGLP